jgi:ribose transport system permease protein
VSSSSVSDSARRGLTLILRRPLPAQDEPAALPGRGLDRLLEGGLYLALIGLVIGFSIASPYFLTNRNIVNIALAVSITGLLAAGFTVALIAGQLDLTVGSVIGLSSTITATLVTGHGWATLPAVAVAMAAGLLVGAINGVLVVNFNINSIIATLAFGITVQGVALILSSGETVPITNTTLQNAVNDRPLGIPIPVWILLGVYLAVYLLLVHTRAGWHVYATGGNASAALRAGIPVRRLYRCVFLLTALLASAGGVITAGRAGSGAPTYGNGVEFDVLAAVLLGGIGLSGGSGRIERTLAGVLLVGVLTNGLILLDVDSYYQNVARGGVFLLAVVLGAIAAKRRER